MSAEEFLATGDVGVVPWVPLMQFDGQPETLLERCAEKIERKARPKDRADLLAVSEVMTGLRFPDPEMLSFFGGLETMIESPLLEKLMAMRAHDLILDSLKLRFGSVPREITKHLREVVEERKLHDSNRVANTCSDLEVFREKLLS